MEGSQKLQLLISELKVIEYWDAEYYQSSVHKRDEICAFHHRQIRRDEILTEINLLEESCANKHADS